MQRLFCVLIAALATTGAAGRTDSAAEAAAQRWLEVHHQAPGADELGELKGTNPEAYALVKMLLTKQSMGLIKRNPHHGSLSPPPLSTEPLEEAILAPVPPAVVAQGPPKALYGTGPAAPEELPELAPQPPTAPPAMPPPPPISSELPPPLEDIIAGPSPAPAPMESSEATSSSADPPAAAPLSESSQAEAPAEQTLPAEEPALPITKLSAAATSSSLSIGSSGGHNWLNWKPDQMIADNEKMVQNVLGAVAQLTGGRVPARKAKQETSSPLSSEESFADEPQPARRPPVVQAAPIADDLPPAPRAPMVPAAPVAESLPVAQPPAEQAAPVVAVVPPRLRRMPIVKPRPVDTVDTTAVTESSQAQSPADQYLASPEPAMPERSVPQSPADQYLSGQISMPTEAASASDDAIAGHLPETVSWDNPYTFTASTNAQAAATPQQENSYLKDIDFGLSRVDRKFHRTPDDENPYLQGLNMAPAKSAPAEISASALTAMHQSQLLTEHKLLTSFDWGGTGAEPRKRQALIKTPKGPRDPLSGFLGPIEPAPPKKAPPAMVSKNTYLAKLEDGGSVASGSVAVSYSPSSVLASHIEQDNPYLQALDDRPQPAPVQMVAREVAAPTRRKLQGPPRTGLAGLRWRSQPQPQPREQRPKMSMASSKVHQQAAAKTKKKKNQELSGWLGGAAVAKGPDLRAQRLQQAVAQRVADSKNPYLKGLDIDDDMPKVRVQAAPQSKESNPYMASLD